MKKCKVDAKKGLKGKENSISIHVTSELTATPKPVLGKLRAPFKDDGRLCKSTPSRPPRARVTRNSMTEKENTSLSLCKVLSNVAKDCAIRIRNRSTPAPVLIDLEDETEIADATISHQVPMVVDLAGEIENVEATNFRRVTRRSLNLANATNFTRSLACRIVSTPAKKPSLRNPKNCAVVLRRCDYRMSVTSIHKFKLVPKAKDQKHLIRSLQMLQKAIEIKSAKIKQQGKKALLTPVNLLPSRQLFNRAVSTPIILAQLKRNKLRNKKPILKKRQACSKRVPYRLKAARQKQIKKPAHQCQLCNKTFSIQAHLYDHLRKHTGEKPFKCDMCPISFCRNGQLVNHKRSHDLNSKQNLTKREARPSRSYGCSKCDKNFSTYMQQKRHIKNYHLARRLLYRCAICKRCCSSIRLLKLHHLQNHSRN